MIYSNGLRFAVAATQNFTLPLLGPTVTILHPPPNTVLTTGQPLILQGQVIDAARSSGTRLNEDLLWLVDAGLDPAR